MILAREADSQHHCAHKKSRGYQGQDEDGQQTLLHGDVVRGCCRVGGHRALWGETLPIFPLVGEGIRQIAYCRSGAVVRIRGHKRDRG